MVVNGLIAIPSSVLGVAPLQSPRYGEKGNYLRVDAMHEYKLNMIYILSVILHHQFQTRENLG
jgi:hypothetical protein